MSNIKKIKRLIVILGALGIFTTPLAYAQSDIFLGSKKDRESQSSSEGKKPSVFIAPGDNSKSSIKKPFFGKNVFRKDSRLDVRGGVARPGAKLVMPNMDMRGSKTPTKEDLMMMVNANHQVNFEIMQKNSALKLQKLKKNEKPRKQENRMSEKSKKVAEKKKTAVKEQDKKRVEKQKAKPQVFVTDSTKRKKKKKAADGKPQRIFNIYD